MSRAGLARIMDSALAPGERRRLRSISGCCKCEPINLAPVFTHPVLVTHLLDASVRYFLGVSPALAGAAVAATHAPLLSLPPFSSHFILAFSQSTLLVAVGAAACCAKAAGAKASAATKAAVDRIFICFSVGWI